MLVSTADRRVNRHVPVNITYGIGLGEDVREYAVPGAVGCVAAMPLPDGLPRAIPVREITPRDSGPVTVDDAFYDAAVVTEGTAFTAFVRWQEWFNSFPLRIRELRKSRPLCHDSIMARAHRSRFRRHALAEREVNPRRSLPG